VFWSHRSSMLHGHPCMEYQMLDWNEFGPTHFAISHKVVHEFADRSRDVALVSREVVEASLRPHSIHLFIQDDRIAKVQWDENVLAKLGVFQDSPDIPRDASGSFGAACDHNACVFRNLRLTNLENQ
jgi:hypothetical protein